MFNQHAWHMWDGNYPKDLCVWSLDGDRLQAVRPGYWTHLLLRIHKRSGNQWIVKESSWSKSLGSMRTVRWSPSDFTIQIHVHMDHVKIFGIVPFQFYFIVFPQFSVRPPSTTCLILTVSIFIKMQTWIQLMICNVSVPVNPPVHIRTGSSDIYMIFKRPDPGEPW